jgi:hypothetical protein
MVAYRYSTTTYYHHHHFVAGFFSCCTDADVMHEPPTFRTKGAHLVRVAIVVVPRELCRMAGKADWTGRQGRAWRQKSAADDDGHESSISHHWKRAIMLVVSHHTTCYTTTTKKKRLLGSSHCKTMHAQVLKLSSISISHVVLAQTERDGRRGCI